MSLTDVQAEKHIPMLCDVWSIRLKYHVVVEVVGDCLNFKCNLKQLVCSGVLKAGQEEELPDKRAITCYLQKT